MRWLQSKSTGWWWGLVVVLAAVGPCWAQERRIVFQEDWEGPRPKAFVHWGAASRDWEVNFAGPTDERAASGSRSFKLDLTLNGPGHHYWWLPVRLPLSGKLKFRGKMYAEQGGGAAGLRVGKSRGGYWGQCCPRPGGQ